MSELHDGGKARRGAIAWRVGRVGAIHTTPPFALRPSCNPPATPTRDPDPSYFYVPTGISAPIGGGRVGVGGVKFQRSRMSRWMRWCVVLPTATVVDQPPLPTRAD